MKSLTSTLVSLSALLVASCAAGNTGAKLGLRVDHVSLPSLAPPAPIVVPPPCSADMLADLLPEPAPRGGFPAPETAAASAEVATYLAWLHEYATWGRAGWDRAAKSRSQCMGAQ